MQVRPGAHAPVVSQKQPWFPTRHVDDAPMPPVEPAPEDPELPELDAPPEPLPDSAGRIVPHAEEVGAAVGQPGRGRASAGPYRQDQRQRADDDHGASVQCAFSHDLSSSAMDVLRARGSAQGREVPRWRKNQAGAVRDGVRGFASGAIRSLHQAGSASGTHPARRPMTGSRWIPRAIFVSRSIRHFSNAAKQTVSALRVSVERDLRPRQGGEHARRPHGALRGAPGGITSQAAAGAAARWNRSRHTPRDRRRETREPLAAP